MNLNSKIIRIVLAVIVVLAGMMAYYASNGKTVCKMPPVPPQSRRRRPHQLFRAAYQIYFKIFSAKAQLNGKTMNFAGR